MLTRTLALVLSLFGLLEVSSALRAASLNAAFPKLPLIFEPNQGQLPTDVRFAARGDGYSLFLSDRKATLQVAAGEVTMRLIGARTPHSVRGLHPTAARFNYIVGQEPAAWHTAVGSFERVEYAGVYPGIDMIYYGNPHQLEYDLVVSPHADASIIRLAFDGAQSLVTDSNGDLILKVGSDSLRFAKPVIYQDRNGSRLTVDGGYRLRRGRQVSFQIGAYDPNLPLFIDPHFVYGTYLGGTKNDGITGVAYDAQGNIHVSGFTTSTDLRVTLPGSLKGQQDAFVAVLNPDAASLVYMTFLGGADIDRGSAVAADPAGNTYITGLTLSTDFPLGSVAYQKTNKGNSDIFVTKLDTTGKLVASTYIGGSNADHANAIRVDAAGNVYVGGATQSTNFPLTFSAVFHTLPDVILAKLSPDLSKLLYSTPVGGSGNEDINAIHLDGNGNIYGTGFTNSTDLVVTANAMQSTLGGLNDAFVVRVDANGVVAYLSYLGGTADDEGNTIELDGLGGVYVGGVTSSLNFPVPAAASSLSLASPRAAASSPLAFSGFSDGFLSKLNFTEPAHPSYLWASALPGEVGGIGLWCQNSSTCAGMVQYKSGGIAFSTFDPTSGNLALASRLLLPYTFTVTGVTPHPTLPRLTVGGYLSSGGPTFQIGVQLNPPINGQNRGILVEVDAGNEAQQEALPTAADTSVGKVNEPISTATGELILEVTDFSLGGPLPLTFSRYYAAFLKQHAIVSAIGSNWIHNFDWTLSVEATSATVTMRHGKTLTLKPSITPNLWVPSKPEKYSYQMISGAADGSYKLFDPESRLTYVFSSAGALVKITDLNSNALTITQGANGPTDVTDGLGRSLHFTYANNLLTQVQDQTGRTFTYTFSGQNLTAVRDANGNTTTYAYTTENGLSSLLTAATLPAGNIPFTQTFNGFGQAISQTDSGGNQSVLSFAGSTFTATVTDPLGNTNQHVTPGYTVLTQVTDADGHATNMTYDAAGHRLSLVDRVGASTILTYDPGSGYLATLTDPAGSPTSAIYSSQKRSGFQVFDLSQIIYPDGLLATATFDANGNTTKHVDQTGNTRTYAYNNRGQLVTRTNAAGGVTSIGYNPDGTVASVQAPTGEVTHLTYDSHKRVSGAAYEDNTSRSFTYDDLNNPLKITDERANTVQLSFDANNQLSSITDPAGATKTFIYDGNGRVTQATNRLGKTRRYQYNETSQVKSVTNEAGETYTWNYDKFPRLTSILDRTQKGLTFTYNAGGYISSAADALGRTVQYTEDLLGRITGVKSALGANFSFAYNAAGLPTQFTDALSHTTSYQYNALGSVVEIDAPAGGTALYSYNKLRWPTAITDPNGHTWKQAFDNAGRIVNRTDPVGRTATYTYGQRGRLSAVSTSAGSAAFTYDPAGNLTRAKYSDGTDLQFTVDNQNRVIGANGVSLGYDAESRIVSSNGLTIDRDSIGRIVRITLAPGAAITYTYNVQGLLGVLADWFGGVTRFTYDDAGQLLTITRPNGVVTTYTYDKDGRKSSIVDAKDSTQLCSILLQRDVAGQVIAATRTIPQSTDPALGTLPLTYDAANQATGGYGYDGLGRRTQDSLRTYTWDASSRLTGYSGADGTATFTYDGFGNRNSVTTDVGARNFVMNYGLWRPAISVIRSGGNDLRYYVPLLDGTILYSVEAAGHARTFFHFDEMGSTTFLGDDSGAIVAAYGITPYGEIVTTEFLTQSGIENPFTYLGAYGVMQEGATGLFYMRAREYDSVTASFLSPDPIRSLDPRSMNPYQYARGNPLFFRDPSGLAPGPLPDGQVVNYEHGIGYWDSGVAVYRPRTRQEQAELGRKLRKALTPAVENPFTIRLPFSSLPPIRIVPDLSNLPQEHVVDQVSEAVVPAPELPQAHPMHGGGASAPPTADAQQVAQNAGPGRNPQMTPQEQDSALIKDWFNTHRSDPESAVPPTYLLNGPPQPQLTPGTVPNHGQIHQSYESGIAESPNLGLAILTITGAIVYLEIGDLDPLSFQLEDGPPTPPVRSIIGDLKPIIVIN